MVEVFHGIWIGNKTETEKFCDLEKKRQNVFPPSSLQGILNVADDAPEPSHSRRILYIHAGLTDGPGNSIHEYYNAIVSLDFLRKSYSSILVHCHEGRSRSCFVVACYLANYLGKSYLEVKKEMKEKYPQLNIHLEHEKLVQSILDYLRKMEIK